MSVISTKTPIYDDIPSIQFFNGRLLSGEDMSTEQAWNARPPQAARPGDGQRRGLRTGSLSVDQTRACR